ncbi:MAG: SPL family radical SAM protein [Thermomicrobiales bacterium]
MDRRDAPGGRRGTRYHEQQAKTIVNAVKGMPFHWSVSPYRGCVHACSYCYARATHPFLGFDAGADFEHEIVVKVNAPELLQRELRHPRLRGQTIIMGTVSDPYQPAEHRYRLTRQLLHILEASGNPVGISTKSTIVTQDLGILVRMAARNRIGVNLTITTLDRDLARLLEPRTPSPEQRLATVRALAEAGVPAGIFCAPILPGLTDDADDLERLAEAVASHGGRWMMSGVLRIGDGFARPFLDAARRDFPHLVRRYERQASRGFRGSASPDEVAAIQGRMDEIRARYGLLSGPPGFPKPPVAEQAPLPLFAAGGGGA